MSGLQSTDESFGDSELLLVDLRYTNDEVLMLIRDRARCLVAPSLLQLQLDKRPMKNQSVFHYDDGQRVSVMCEVYSYPRSSLQLTWSNRSLVPQHQTSDCFNDDLSTIVLTDASCLSQTNWRIRVRITSVIDLSHAHDREELTCSVQGFPYGIGATHSTSVQLIRGKG